MTEADRILLRVRLAGIRAEERALAEELGDVAESPALVGRESRKPKPRRARGPTPVLAPEKPVSETAAAKSRAALARVPGLEVL